MYSPNKCCRGKALQEVKTSTVKVFVIKQLARVNLNPWATFCLYFGRSGSGLSPAKISLSDCSD
jgi:hypothetical protein